LEAIFLLKMWLCTDKKKVNWKPVIMMRSELDTFRLTAQCYNWAVLLVQSHIHWRLTQTKTKTKIKEKTSYQNQRKSSYQKSKKQLPTKNQRETSYLTWVVQDSYKLPVTFAPLSWCGDSPWTARWPHRPFVITHACVGSFELSLTRVARTRLAVRWAAIVWTATSSRPVLSDGCRMGNHWTIMSC
jgi:hypothetical protein